MTDHPNPFPVQKRAYDIRTYCDTPYVFDVTPGDRLAIGNKCQCFQERAGVTGRTLLPQLCDPLTEILLNLKPVARSNLFQLKSPIITVLRNCLHHLLQLIPVGLLTFLEHCNDVVQSQRSSGGKKATFNDHLNFVIYVTHAKSM